MWTDVWWAVMLGGSISQRDVEMDLEGDRRKEKAESLVGVW